MRFLWAALSGALLISVFPFASLDLVAWFALVPLLLALDGISARRAAVLGGLTGIVGWAGVFYWIIPLIRFNTGSLAQAIVCLGALASYLAVYVAVWAVAVAAARPAGRVAQALVAAVVWTGLEYVRTYALTGFPWALVGYSQYRTGWILPLAQFTGVYGVSFVIVGVNAAVAACMRSSGVRAGRLVAGAIAAVVIILRVAIAVPAALPDGKDAVVFGIVQPSVDQYIKWDARYDRTVKERYESLADQIARRSPRIIVWPETVVTGFLPVDAAARAWAEALVRRTGSINVIGAPFADPDGAQYNASVVFSADGSMAGVHRKTHLVPFGEFVPLRAVLEPFFGVLNMLGDYRRGAVLSPIDADGVMLGINICSENFFGNRVRRLAASGATVLVNQTNDAWFFNTAAPEQHFIMNVFRAVENNRPVVVAGNTGVSGVISSRGRILVRTPVFEKTWLTASVTPCTQRTFYTRHGDVFAIACCAVALLYFLWRLVCLMKCRRN